MSESSTLFLAVVTRFLGPTNHRGARVVATLPSGKRVTVAWDHALGERENHARAAALAIAHTGYNPNGRVVTCSAVGDRGYVVGFLDVRGGA
jgi:hypothetical protein